MYKARFVFGTASALVAVLAAFGCPAPPEPLPPGSTSAAGVGAATTATTGTSTTSTSTSASSAGGSTSTATGAGGSTSTTSTGGGSCPFTSADCETCLAQSCTDTSCAMDPTCQAAFDTMRKGCACAAQMMMDKAAQDACISQFDMDAKTAAQVDCVVANCAGHCYLQ
jgi:hypothetical protein